MIGAALVGFFHYVKVGPSEVEEDEPESRADARHRDDADARADRSIAEEQRP
jgi:formate dehydrogenase iron-sulfur subunit